VGAGSRLYYLDVPEDVLLARVNARNAELPPDSFRIDPELVSHWFRTIFSRRRAMSYVRARLPSKSVTDTKAVVGQLCRHADAYTWC
jgi:hypothetical protein